MVNAPIPSETVLHLAGRDSNRCREPQGSTAHATSLRPFHHPASPKGKRMVNAIDTMLFRSCGTFINGDAYRRGTAPLHYLGASE